MNENFYKALDKDKRRLTRPNSDGLRALEKLISIAETSGSGQGITIQRFLLGIYNGNRFPFNLNTLRGLDSALQEACFFLLVMDVIACEAEIHTYLKRGSARFEAMATLVYPESYEDEALR